MDEEEEKYLKLNIINLDEFKRNKKSYVFSVCECRRIYSKEIDKSFMAYKECFQHLCIPCQIERMKK